MSAIKKFIEQEVYTATANSPACMYPALVNAFKKLGVAQPQDLSRLFPPAAMPTSALPMTNSAPSMGAAPAAAPVPVPIASMSTVGGVPSMRGVINNIQFAPMTAQQAPVAGLV